MKKDMFFMRIIKKLWIHGWLKISGLPGLKKLATFFASWAVPPHKAGTYVASINRNGYTAPTATLYHSDLKIKHNVFIGERVIIYQAKDGGYVELEDRVHILRDTILETGLGGSIQVGKESWIHPRCQINAYVEDIIIGEGVWMAPNCSLYSYDHAIAPDMPIRSQPLQSQGQIVIEDEVWVGVGCIILSGVRIGEGAVLAAGSVVTRSVPPGAVVAGSPARVVKYRDGRSVPKA